MIGNGDSSRRFQTPYLRSCGLFVLLLGRYSSYSIVAVLVGWSERGKHKERRKYLVVAVFTIMMIVGSFNFPCFMPVG
jgi:hypothetical protein